MVGVKSWDALFDEADHGMPYRMDQTTLHHIFDGGWMWVIPFDNHAQATNNLCSVGVMFDSQKHPKTDATPEQEFAAFLGRYPSIAEQFVAAKSVRKWVSSPRIQYSSSKLSVGRYFALPHAAAFIDPLFSTGLNLTAHAVNVLGDILIDSFKSGQLHVERLQKLERQIIHKVEIYDKLVSRSFKAFKNFDLWNAWYRVWEVGTYFNTLGAMRCIMKYNQTGDPAYLRARFEGKYAAPLAYGVDGYAQLLDGMAAIVDRVAAGEFDETSAVDAIYAQLEEFPAMPSFISRRERQVRTIGTFTLSRLLRMFVWGKLSGPLDTRHYYDFNVTTFASEIVTNLCSYLRRQSGVSVQPLWDMFAARSSNSAERNLRRGDAWPLRKLKSSSAAPRESVEKASARRSIPEPAQSMA
jgi:FADH2 O2-dependent halogenase